MSGAANPVRSARPGAIALAALAIGVALRLWLSRGPLWNDEIWSIQNLAGLSGPCGVLWDISHDNNHFLNSLWLYGATAAGGDPSWLRALSLLAGAGVVAVMARLGGRAGPPGGAMAAALAAASFFQILYSAEARGYACATLALVVAYDALERGLDSDGARGKTQLALAAGLGFFSHLAFGPAMALLGLAGLAESARRSRSARRSLAFAWRLFAPAALAMTPTLAFVVAGYVRRGGFTIGYFRPFAPSHAIAGYVNMEMATFGLDPTAFWPTMFGLVALPALALIALLTLAPPERRIACGVMIFAPPALALLAQLPNTHVPRYFFAASPFLLLLAADSLAALWRRGPRARAAAALLLAATLASDAGAVLRMQSGQTTGWTDALAAVDSSDDRSIASSFDLNVGRSVAYFNGTRAGRLEMIPPGAVCRRGPGWFVLETGGKGEAAPHIEIGQPDCRLGYDLAGVYDRDIPDQLPWGLYRRQPAPR